MVSQGLFPPVLDLNSLSGDGAIGGNLPSFTFDEHHIRSSVRERLLDVHDRNDGKLSIIQDTLVTKILLCSDSDGQPKAYGVEYATNGALPVASNFNGKSDLNVTTVKAKKEVIVSAGVFQTPQLVRNLVEICSESAADQCVL